MIYIRPDNTNSKGVVCQAVFSLLDKLPSNIYGQKLTAFQKVPEISSSPLQNGMLSEDEYEAAFSFPDTRGREKGKLFSDFGLSLRERLAPVYFISLRFVRGGGSHESETFER